MSRFSPLFPILLLLFGAIAPTLAAPFTLGSSSLDLALTPTFEHADVRVQLIPGGSGFDFASLQLVSNANWVSASKDAVTSSLVLKFATTALSSSPGPATITVSHGTTTATIAVKATRSETLDIVQLIDDPFRSRMYGLQQNDSARGSVLILEPLTGQRMASITVGKGSGAMAVSNDGSELFVVDCADKALTVINLNNLSVSQNMPLPQYVAGDGYFDSRIVTGPGATLYITDASGYHTLRVYNRVTGQLLQSILLGTIGLQFEGIACTPDKTQFYGVGWAQGPLLARYSIGPTGTLTFVEETSEENRRNVYSSYSTPLISNDGKLIFVNKGMITPNVVNDFAERFSTGFTSISPDGEIAGTTSGVYQTSTGKTLLQASMSPVQAISSDSKRLVHVTFSYPRDLVVVDLTAIASPAELAQTLSPADGSKVLPPSDLKWPTLPGTGYHHVYFGTAHAAVAAATAASPEYLGSTPAARVPVPQNLTPLQTYYWRVDTQLGGVRVTGPVHSFTVSPLTASQRSIDATTVEGHIGKRVTVALTSATPGLTWTASADQPWVSFTSATGTCPADLEIILNAENLTAGGHLATVTLAGTSGPLCTLPLRLWVEPLKLQYLMSDPTSTLIYGISEDFDAAGAHAYLIEIDSALEKMVRVERVGKAVRDLALHKADNRLYVTNWRKGALLGLNKDTLALEQTYSFTPYVDAYTSGDAYKVAAGGAGRVVVEEGDQWINVTLLNTVTGAKPATTNAFGNGSLRAGSGLFDPTGRYYYHGGDDTVTKFDMTGDAFGYVTRKQLYDYFGSDRVLMSESGNGVFFQRTLLDPNLIPQWTVGADIHSTTADARLAFGKDDVFDTVVRQQVLSMPVSTHVSGHNSTTGKLVVQVGNRIGFYPIQYPLSLPAPVLAAGSAIKYNSIPLLWSDNSLESSFTLQRRLAGTGTWTTVTPAPSKNQTSATVSSLTASTSYEFRIRAEAPGLSSDWSNVLAASTAPTSVPYLSISFISVSQTGNRVYFSYSSFPSSFTLERATSAQGPWTLLASGSFSQSSYLDGALLPTPYYYYRVKGVVGGVQTAYSIDSVNGPLPPLPDAPQHFTYHSVDDVRVRLAWTAVPGVTGYLIERKLASEIDWSSLANLPPDITSCTDNTVIAGKAYVYRITSANTSGSSSAVVATPRGPEVTVSGNGVDIADGDSTPSMTDFTDVGSVATTGSTMKRTFAISNPGTAPLALGSVTVGGTDAADFSVSTQPATNVDIAGSTTFEVTFNPSANGLRSATLSFVYNENRDGNPFNFSIQGWGLNTAPTAIALSASSIAENNTPHAAVGTLSVTDADPGDAPIFSLVGGAGSTDNGSFSITGTTLKLTSSADFEMKSSYAIRIGVNDGQGGAFGSSFTIAIIDELEAPIVTKPTVAGITATAADLGGNVVFDGGTAIMERGVVYAATATNVAPTIGGPGVTKVTEAGTTGVFTASVTGLSPNTNYSFRAYATNVQGTSYTSGSTFTTRKLMPDTLQFSAATADARPVNPAGQPDSFAVEVKRTGDADGAVSAVVTASQLAWVPSGFSKYAYGIHHVFTSPASAGQTVVSFVDGQTTAMVNVQLLAPAVTKKGQFALTLSDATGGASIGSPAAMTITVKARDASKPIITIAAPATSFVAGVFDVAGTVNDNDALSAFTLKLNGAAVPVAVNPMDNFAANTKVPYAASGLVPENGSNTIAIEAVDMSGIKTVVTKTVTYTNIRQSLAGTYSAVCNPIGTVGTGTTGLVTSTVTPAGALTGKIAIGGTSFSFSGWISNAGAARFKPALAVTLPLKAKTNDFGNLSFSISEPDGLTGAITAANGGVVLASLAGKVAPYTTQNRVPQSLLNLPVTGSATRGAYTVVFPSESNDSAASPTGRGFATLTLTNAGSVTLAGDLADGTKWTASTKLRADASLPIFVPLYVNKGSLSGDLVFDDLADSHLSGEALIWIRPPQPTAGYYRAGWPAGMRLHAVGAKYANPASLDFGQGSADVINGNASLTFTDGLLNANIGKAVSVDPSTGAVKIAPAGSKSYSLTLPSSTGVISGTFIHTSGKTSSYRGILINKGINRGGFGYFLSPKPAAGTTGEAGSVWLDPAGP